MSKLMSTSYTTGSFNLATLLMRLSFGALMINHGLQKFKAFDAIKPKFMSLFGLGQGFTLGLVIFAEVICAGLVLIGLFTRFATIPVIIVMSVALFMAHKGLIFGEGEMAALFLTGYLALLIVGPGKISVDGMAGK
ncbi:DoxX family protein [Pseudoflavitalea rhizosphaerae]|uniref:DoxX family protein n=1 Tax=Pseudoflavitalea rhizosphaerae TaxID=1884793 RepID=UPI000F8F79A4|nr:DoxX family protein [Pseudoflavitalea rhizosphaerae]